MRTYDYDLFVIGAGSAGVRAARLAGAAGARVAIAEEREIGGACVLRGCVPKKLLVYASEFGRSFGDAAAFGWDVDAPRFSWPRLRYNVQSELRRLSRLYSAGLENAGVTIMKDRAILSGAHEVRLARAGRTVTAERILIAAGARPYRPLETPGQAHGITSDDAFLLESLPRAVVIAGGGYIALEFAAIFVGLGVDTTLVYRGARVLRGFDADVRAHVQSELERLGVKIVCDATIAAVALRADGAMRVRLSDQSEIEAEQVLWALGRTPNTDGLGLDAAGVAADEGGAIVVDAFSRSSVSSIWAVGDVTNRINLTPVAIREAQAFVRTEFLGAPTIFDHADVASAVFTAPPAAAVGLTEEAARERGHKLCIYRTMFRPMKSAFTGGEQRTMMKIVSDAETDRILGVHIVGVNAPEMIQLAAVAIKAGITKARWDDTCAVHPTSAEELVLMGAPVSIDA